MAFTAADVEAIERAIARGETKVRFADGREVTYRTVEDLLRARSAMQAETTVAADPLQQPGGVTYAVFSRD